MKLMKIDEIMLPFASICPKVGFWRWNTGDTCGHGGHGGHGSPVNMARLARDSARLPSLFGRKSLEQRTPPASQLAEKYAPAFPIGAMLTLQTLQCNDPKLAQVGPSWPKLAQDSPGSPPPPLPGHPQTPRCLRAWPGRQRAAAQAAAQLRTACGGSTSPGLAAGAVHQTSRHLSTTTAPRDHGTKRAPRVGALVGNLRLELFLRFQNSNTQKVMV